MVQRNQEFIWGKQRMIYRMAENIDKNWVKNINRIFREPDMIFYIDITPQESIRRNTDTKFNIIEFAW